MVIMSHRTSCVVSAMVSIDAPRSCLTLSPPAKSQLIGTSAKGVKRPGGGGVLVIKSVDA